LSKRFPGIPIPIVPPKKAIGNKDLTFVQDRTFYLQRFLRKLARFDFIIESQEFQAFARPANGMKVETALTRLMPMTTAQLHDRIKAITDCDVESVDTLERDQAASRITSLLFFIKTVEPLLQKIKQDLSKYLMSKQRSIQAYGEMAKFTQRYEELNMTHYADMDSHQLIFQNPDSPELRDGLTIAAQQLRNPYIDLYHWVKGELYDIEAIRNAVKCRTDVMVKLRELEGKKRDAQKDMESVSAGKKTVTTLFKN
jgi:sorting nexin-1/2